MWHFLFPSGSAPGVPDEMFAEQHAALTAAGFTASVCPDDVPGRGESLRGIPPGSTVVYRGWMLTEEEYARLVRAIEQAGAVPLTHRRDQRLSFGVMPVFPPKVGRRSRCRLGRSTILNCRV